MGLKERFGRAPSDPDVVSEEARRKRAAERAALRQARRASGPTPPAREVPGASGGVLGAARQTGLEVLALLAQVWIALAEIAGRVVLAVWLLAFRLARVAGRACAAGVRLLERRIVPAHGTLAATLAALAILIVSQFFDYRGVSVSTGEYTGGAELVAPAPDVGRERTGDAHAWAVLPIAAVGLLAVAFAVLGRRGVARLLVPAGVAVLAIALLVDMPKGLEEGSAAVAYDGASARLLEGFWAQTIAAGTLIVCGLLLPLQLGARAERTDARGGSSGARHRRARRRSRPKAARA